MKNNIEIIKYNSLDHHELIIFGNCNINEKNKNKNSTFCVYSLQIILESVHFLSVN